MAGLHLVTVSRGAENGQVATNEVQFREIGDGQWKLDQIHIDKKSGLVRFPAAVNMTTGLVEYVLVTTGGKVHESLFRTEINPRKLHLAMLLLGVKAATGANPASFYDPKSKVPGGSVNVEVTWNEDGKLVRKNASEILADPAKKNLVITNWIYNGSQLIEGVFSAEKEGSIISLIADPYALINNPREDRQNDELWTARPQNMPMINSPVEITIKLVPSAEATGDQPK